MISSNLMNEIFKLKDHDECEEAWKMIKARWQDLEGRIALSKVYDFVTIGRDVKFKGRGNRVLQGKIEKLNLKTVRVNCGPAGIWNVRYSGLEKVED